MEISNVAKLNQNGKASNNKHLLRGSKLNDFKLIDFNVHPITQSCNNFNINDAVIDILNDIFIIEKQSCSNRIYSV